MERWLNIILKIVVAIMVCFSILGLLANIAAPFILHKFSLIYTMTYIIWFLFSIFTWRNLCQKN
jgi:hypothetical protein